MAIQVFISSPVKELKEKREAIYDSLIKLGFKNIFLSEADRSRDQSSYQTCINEVEKSNLFILILGKYYGWIPENEKYSITELEYNKAIEKKHEILVFKLDYFDYEEAQVCFIKKVEDFYSGKFRGKCIENTDELKNRVFNDIPQHFVAKSEAVKMVPVKNTLESDIIIGFQESKNIIFKEEIDLINSPLLLFKARINYDIVAGNGWLTKLYFNDYELNENDLINKPNKYILIDKRENLWYHNSLHCWSLSYSPNFKDNYMHQKYKIMNGDPYINIFSLKNVKLKEKNNILKIIHSGNKDNKAHKNSIIIGKCELIK